MDSTFAGNKAPGGTGGAIYNTGDLTMTGCTVSDGLAGAGLTGGVDNSGTLSVTKSHFARNVGGFAAGAIGNSGTLTITDSTFDANAGGVAGAVNNGGPATISGCTFSDNNAFSGDAGAIYNANTLTIATSTFSTNTATAQGGGIFNSGSNAKLSVTASTFSGNAAGGGQQGGGVYNDPMATVTITNCTFSANMGGAAGGGIYSAGTATVRSSTFSANTAAGIVTQGGGSMLVQNTIVAKNVPVDCIGLVTSLGNNLDGPSTCGFAGAGDLHVPDPLLGPLADNGGPTPTEALLLGSPAIDAGSGDCPGTDQRGTARPMDGDGVAVCDIGAYEVPAPVTTTTTTSTTLPCPAAPTFDSIRCRLATLLAAMQAQVAAGRLRDGLVAALTKATTLTEQAEAGMGKAHSRRSKKRLAGAIGALKRFETKLQAHQAKRLQKSLRTDLRARSKTLRKALATLGASL